MRKLLFLVFLGGCSRMGDRPPWWKVESPPPVDTAILCSKPAVAASEVPPDLEATVKMVQAKVLANYSSFAHCYEGTLARDPVAYGRVMVRALIAQSGEVEEACVESYEIPDGDLLGCTVNTLKTVRFGELPRRLTFVYPFVYRPAR